MNYWQSMLEAYPDARHMGDENKVRVAVRQPVRDRKRIEISPEFRHFACIFDHLDQFARYRIYRGLCVLLCCVLCFVLLVPGVLLLGLFDLTELLK